MEYIEITQRLQKVYDTGEARALARMVLEERFGMSLTDIMCGKVTELSREECSELEKIIVRLEKNEPIQYILGYAAFCGKTFHVAPGALIPRPETEEVVAEAYRMAQECSEGEVMRILDVGTGSGCIAISLALMAREDGKLAEVTAWDISREALAVAMKNNVALGAGVAFEEADILKKAGALEIRKHSEETDTSGKQSPTDESRLTLIVSNPPYICHKEKKDMERNVLDYEPHCALFVPDDDPMLFYRNIARYALHTLKGGGGVVFEINRAYGKEVCTMLEAMGFSETKVLNDQYGNKRIVTARKI